MLKTKKKGKKSKEAVQDGYFVYSNSSDKEISEKLIFVSLEDFNNSINIIRQ